MLRLERLYKRPVGLKKKGKKKGQKRKEKKKFFCKVCEGVRKGGINAGETLSSIGRRGGQELSGFTGWRE